MPSYAGLYKYTPPSKFPVHGSAPQGRIVQNGTAHTLEWYQHHDHTTAPVFHRQTFEGEMSEFRARRFARLQGMTRVWVGAEHPRFWVTV